MSHIGRVRSRNEDAYLLLLDASFRQGLFAVADGLGGHVGGDVASATAVAVLRGQWEEGVSGDPLEWLEAGVRGVHQAIREKTQEDVSLVGMGTTLTVLLLRGPQGFLVHVGDSRAYRLRTGRLELLTRDHTLAALYVAAGLLTPEQARGHPYRHVLEQALGVAPGLEVDRSLVEVLPGDRYLLCSDGLTEMVPDPDLLGILREAISPQVACQCLIEAANQRGGVDNITAVVVDCEGS